MSGEAADPAPREIEPKRSEADPIPASSVIVLRGDPFEVLMLRRHDRHSFVPGAWVFAGGAVDEADRTIAAALAPSDHLLTTMKICGLRELLEETGLWPQQSALDLVLLRHDLLRGVPRFDELRAEIEAALPSLTWFSRWITPKGNPKRFDTWFFLLEVAPDAVAEPEQHEAIDAVWLRPQEALARHEGGAMPMVFPTLRTLEHLARFRDASGLLSDVAGRTIRPIEPVMITEHGKSTIVLPEEER